MHWQAIIVETILYGVIGLAAIISLAWLAYCILWVILAIDDGDLNRRIEIWRQRKQIDKEIQAEREARGER